MRVTQLTVLFHKQDGRCWLCNTQLRLPGDARDVSYPVATIDHIIPVSRKGSGEITNLLAACCKCNRERGNNMFLTQSEIKSLS